ncbi:hypothetical protein SCUCBS95973_006962 [Sporothrix curviconia]|uniref:Uncharacterized protein n=1 Tax=Sporothrix curviconia TaxID=1260050 RepID=A0ABP0CAM8_9PEZI
MTIAIRQLVAIALGYISALSGPGAREDQGSVAGIPKDLSDGFVDGYTPQPAIEGRPPQIGFRRPQQSERVKRDCLANGTNFCFGDSNNYCSSCGTCCSASTDSNNKVLVTETSFMSVTLTHVVTDIATVIQKVIETSVVYSTVDVTNTNAATQTNWIYVTATTVGKRALPAPTLTTHEPTATDSLPIITPTATTTAPALTSAAPADAAKTEAIRPRDSEPVAETQVAVQSTSVVHEAVTNVVTITSTIASTTTVLTTSTEYQTLFHTKTIVLNAKATVEATSAWTITSHFPVTLTVTALATAKPTGVVASSSTVAPALITSVASGDKTTSKPLSTGSIAGIAVGATFAGIALCVILFLVWNRHQKAKREREAITEDYAYLGTGRSHGFDSAQVGRSNSGSGGGGNRPPQLYRNVYSGPPSNTARMDSVRKPSMAMTQVDSNERGLPPAPWYTINTNTNTNARTSPRTSPTASPVSPTASSLPFGSEANNQLAYGRAVHLRSGSAQTNATALSSTVVGGGNNSTRNSTRSNSSKAARLSAGGIQHKRASSSGGGSGITNETSTADEASEEASKEGVSSYYNLRPAELDNSQAPMLITPPDPPSPMLEPRLGPLRIINASASVNGSVDELPNINDETGPPLHPPAPPQS